MLFTCIIFCTGVFAQVRGKKVLTDDNLPVNNDQFNDPNNNVRQNGKATTPRKDSLGFEHRDDSKDSITIKYRLLNQPGWNNLDSSVNNFDRYFSVPSSYLYLGNNGAAATSLIYQPEKTIGFDPGFHAFDLYRLSPEQTFHYRTTKPFTGIQYQLASGKEQMLKATHTQNPRPNFNFGFNYNLITSPGFFVTQNNNHNGYRIFSDYQGKRKRYAAFFTMCGNNIRASENGGIENEDDLLNPNFKNRFTVPTRMGSASRYNNNPFVTTIFTGNLFRDFHIQFSQQYDIGQRDSLKINDSTTEYLFYPRLRLQHTSSIHQYNRRFRDFFADSVFYQDNYAKKLSKLSDTFDLSEQWKIWEQDFSLWQFPDKKNQAQYLRAGITYQQMRGEWRDTVYNFNNVWAHGTYRNRTRNKKWDMLLDGQLYLSGLNSGDYNIQASLQRKINKKWGDVQLNFSNVNRTPAFTFDARSVFNWGAKVNIKKENIISVGLTSDNALFSLSVQNHLISNHPFYSSAYQAAQTSQVINLTQVSLSKKIRLKGKWNLYTDATLQQIDLSAPIRVPLLFLRNRLAYEGQFFKNLNLSAGLETRYFASYKGYGYSPVMGAFTLQDTSFIKNLPDVALFAHFRIKGFSGFIRAENLNTMNFSNGFGWVNNNFAAPNYPTQGFLIRFGVRWWFVN